MIDVDADLAIAFSTNDFGESVVFATTPSPLTVTAIYKAGTESVSQYGMEVEAYGKSLTCRTSDIATVRDGMSVTVRGDSHTVEKIKDIGTGVSVVFLKT